MVSVSVHREDRWCVHLFFLTLASNRVLGLGFFFLLLLAIVSAMVNNVQRAASGCDCQKE